MDKKGKKEQQQQDPRGLLLKLRLHRADGTPSQTATHSAWQSDRMDGGVRTKEEEKGRGRKIAKNIIVWGRWKIR